VIPHYKNEEALLSALSHNLPFLTGCEIIVVNDNPTIALHNTIKKIFPTITVIDNKKNVGFAGAVSGGITATKNQFVLLLNDDVLLEDNTWKKALEFFNKDTSLFAVSFKQKEKSNVFVGKNKIYWKSGFFYHSKVSPDDDGINGWAEGGSMLFDKKKYNEIHGFDTLYSPFYWEDVDLSYRAWKAGYSIIFDSSHGVEHHHESTISTYFKTSHIQTISYRNQLITIWKNISDGKMIFEHFIFLIVHLARSLITGNRAFIEGFQMAFNLRKEILKKRNEQKILWKKSDNEIFTLFKNL